MAESKHTPGPWVASKFGTQVLTGDSWNSICVLKGRAQWEDGRGTVAEDTEWQNQEANARLIAAAPDLLAALTDTLRMLEAAHRELGYLHRDNPRVIKARVAISKAEGTEPAASAA